MSFDARFVIIGVMGTALLAWVIFCAIKFILQGRDLILKSGFTVHVKCENAVLYTRRVQMNLQSREFQNPGVCQGQR